MNANDSDDVVIARIAAAIGEPARSRMLCSLMDGHARTSTELAVIAGVNPSTASAHLARLKDQQLVKVLIQGKHRYYRLEGPNVARVLEGLGVLAGDSDKQFVPSTPSQLRVARTCYDHMAGTLGVLLHDRIKSLGWMSVASAGDGAAYELTLDGRQAFASLGIDIEAIQTRRRRFAYACLDWSERSPHIGGALGAALLGIALKKKWVTQELDSRVLNITNLGRREMLAHFGIST